MATSAVKHGELVTLEELNPSSPHFTQGASLRVTGKLVKFFCFLALIFVLCFLEEMEIK